MKRIIFIFFSIIIFIPQIWAQTEESEELEQSEDLPSDPPSKFDLVFNRGFMMGTGGSLDTVPINGSNSGTFFIGGGIKFPLAKNKMGIRATPGISFTQINYNQTNLKTFPTIPDSLSFTLTAEKHRLTHISLPLGFYVNVSRDEDNDPKFFVEAGGYFSYLLSAGYQYKYLNSSGQRVHVNNQDLEKEINEFEKIKYGIYARVGYKWASLYFNIRLTDVFDEFANDAPKDVTGFKNPIIPPMQLGLTIFL